MAKTQTLYQVRIWPAQPRIYSKPVGFKGRLVGRNKASAVVKRLKRAGLEAFSVKWRSNCFGAN